MKQRRRTAVAVMTAAALWAVAGLVPRGPVAARAAGPGGSAAAGAATAGNAGGEPEKTPPIQGDDIVALLRDYLRIDTSNPPGNEMRAARFFT